MAHLRAGTAKDAPFLARGLPPTTPMDAIIESGETAAATDTQTLLGNTVTNTNGRTSANFFNSVYAVTGSNSAGYTVAFGTMCFAPGTVTSGKSTDIGIVPAASPTTEATTALCSATYTHTSSTSPGCVNVRLSGCGTLKPRTAYWIFSITNDPISGSPYYFTNCGGSCTSTVPTNNVGNYHSFYVGRTYGAPYTNLPTSFTAPNTNQVSNYVTLSPVADTPVISWATPVPVASGTVLGTTQLNATANVPGRFVYTPAAGAVLTTGTQPLRALFLPTDTTKYSSISAFTTLLVNPASAPKGNVPTITWNTPQAITYGTPLSNTQLNATANVPGAFVYTPVAGTVLRAGKQLQTVSVTFKPTDLKYSAVSASVHLIVNQATPRIAWPAPASISAGTALSTKQLDAAANVPGTFIYNPAVGKVLSAGTQQLTAVFSPTDSTDYSSAAAHTSLVVSSPAAGPTPTPTPTPTPVPPSPGPAPVGCGGPTINLNSGMSTSTLQSAISSAANCALLVFAAGTYNINSTLYIPCHSLTITGPAVTPATAEITTSTANISLFKMSGGCTSGTTTIEYLRLDGAGAFITDGASYSNINILHNQMTSIPSEESCGAGCESVFFNFNPGITLSNINIEYNKMGDDNSCVAGANMDEGNCAGVIVNAVNGGLIQNFFINHNVFYHLQEGVHFPVQNFSSGAPEASCDNCQVQWNFFSQIHRIQVEFQIGVLNHPFLERYNVLTSPLDTNANAGMFAFSNPCCQFGGNFGKTTNTYIDASSNIIYDADPLTSQYGISWGFEAWGNGGQYNNNLIQGYVCAGIVWGLGSNWSASHNTMQGPTQMAGAACPFYSPLKGGFIGPEFPGAANAQIAPAQTGNVFGGTPTAVTSITPTISPASGTQTFPLTVTLTDPGYTSGSVPLANTGIWYTTDGSTPVPGSGTAKYVATGGTFVLSSSATVKAVGMWGAANQPTSYPAGYGFVPSSVVTAAYSPSGAIQRPAATANASASLTGKMEADAGTAGATLVSVAITPSQPSVAIGSTTQLKATATFGDGSTKDVTANFSWQSSDVRTMTANGSGTLAGVASGKATISGSYQGLQASAGATSAIGEAAWNDPITITEGGTYSGNWQSTDTKTPAVTIATTAPVIIENAHMRSVGDLIKTSVAGTNLTVRNSLGVALNAAVKGQPNGTFLDVTSPARLDVESNYIENAHGGVIVHGYAGSRDGEQTIVIRSNRARNMNGMLSDGHGGYLAGEGASHSQARFIQFDSLQSVPGIEVGWNEVINYPGRSLVGDNIDVYRSGGTPNRPLEIHDTYIQGAYPYRAAQDPYDGGGIMTDAKAGDSAREVPAFNSIHDNQVVGTVNYGIEFAAGHDNVASNNRVISSGLLSDGTRIAAQGAGMVDGDASGVAVATGSMYNNTMHDNLVGWMCWKSSCAKDGYRMDQSFPAAPGDYSTNSVVAGRQITLDMENNEYQVWLKKVSDAGIAVGPTF